MRLAAVLFAATKTFEPLVMNAVPTCAPASSPLAPRAGRKTGSDQMILGRREWLEKVLACLRTLQEHRRRAWVPTELAARGKGDVRAAGAAPGCQHAAGVAQGEEGLCVHGGSAEWGVQRCERHDDVPHVGLIVHSSQRNQADHVPGTRPTVHAPAVRCRGPSRCTGVRRVRARTDSPLEAHAVTAGGRVWCD